MVVGARLGLVNVEVRPGVEAIQASESFQACLHRIPLRIEPRQLGSNQLALVLQLGELGAERGDLSFVGPAEDPPTGVVDAVPVVLLVALPGAHLALASHGPALAGELLKAGRTPVIGPLRELVDEVLTERPVLDLDAVCEQKPVMPR